MEIHYTHNVSDSFYACYGCGMSLNNPRLSEPCPTPDLVGQSRIEHKRKEGKMEDKDIPNAEPHPWHPMTNTVDLKHLEKLGEEAGELVSAICRCLCQGIDQCEPDTGKLNRHWLEDEIADVIANIRLVRARFHLDGDRIASRAAKKKAKLEAWHRMA